MAEQTFYNKTWCVLKYFIYRMIIADMYMKQKQTLW